MNRNETIAFVVLVGLLAITGSGLLYVSLTEDVVADGSEATNETNETVSTPIAESENTTSTTTPTSSTTDGTVSVRGENVLNDSYNREDGSLMVEFRATGDDWQVNLHRSGVSLTTLVPEEYTDADGNTHPTTSYWNQNASLPESKSYAFIGSRIDAGAETATTSDDEYVVTVLLPTVAQEDIRFTLVEDGDAVTFYEAEYN